MRRNRNQVGLPLALVRRWSGGRGFGFALLARQGECARGRARSMRAREGSFPKRRRRGTQSRSPGRSVRSASGGARCRSAAVAGRDRLAASVGHALGAPIAAASAVAASLAWVLEQAMRPRTPPPGATLPDRAGVSERPCAPDVCRRADRCLRADARGTSVALGRRTPRRRVAARQWSREAVRGRALVHGRRGRISRRDRVGGVRRRPGTSWRALVGPRSWLARGQWMTR
jgi:hypothetical protein